MSEAEWERIKLELGGDPGPVGKDNRCPMLTAEKRCSVYQSRPMICRLYGLVDTPTMRCRHGCIPVPRWLMANEGHAFLERAFLLSEYSSDLRVIRESGAGGRVGPPAPGRSS